MPRGRPPLARDQRKSSTLKVYLTGAEYDAIRQAAALDGCEISTWARRVVISKAKSTVKGAVK
jgi:uncharacterized protein (DUF1778 family)